MEPGEILVDEDVETIAAEVVADPDCEIAFLFECLAGADAAAERAIQGRFRALVARLAAEFGAPDETPTRAQGLPDPPRTLARDWVEAAVWRRPDRVIVATLSGAPGKSRSIEVAQEARS